ncbi:MAG: DUF2917 domain-containing protein [Burkholderiales bacterium]|nr:DUF2917 domain-containing protein [Burkholderiales bacterium]
MTIAIAASKAGWSSFAADPRDEARRAPRPAAFPRVQPKPLTRSLTDGRFSLIGSGHVAIAATPGLVVRVRSGALWITQEHDQRDHLVAAGEHFVADRAGRLVVSAFARSEVELVWAPYDDDRLSPGLEPVEIAT